MQIICIVQYRKNLMSHNPTTETYTELQKAYDFFNQALFANQLPSCLITLQRRSRTYGYFSAKRFQHTQAGTFADEIAMNPDHFKTESLQKVLSTLVHEMVHLQQAYFGKPSRKGYHNREWASMMKTVGLIASSTGEPGGNQVGQCVSHYIETGGQFEKTCQTLINNGFKLSWADTLGDQRKTITSTPGRWRYHCKQCGLIAWAKPKTTLICGTCKQPLWGETK